MPNVLFELDRLRSTLTSRGLDGTTIEGVIKKAHTEIMSALESHSVAAMQLAIERGVDMESSNFINELRVNAVTMQLTTDSGNMDFPEPAEPMLHRLLKNAKPMKDGSGVYKVIPVGSPGKDKPKVSLSIYDSWKQLNAERTENAKRQYQKVAPQGSKFRTASSKQDASTKWVRPAKQKDFAEDMRGINTELEQTMDRVIQEIIRSYEENF